MLWRSRAFASVSVLTLALGIGSTSAIFSFVDGVLLRPLPYDHAERIVTLDEREPDGQRNGAISALNFIDWRDRSTVFEAIAANSGVTMTLTGGNEPVLLQGARASAQYFDVFRVAPALGRTFAADEDQLGKDHVIVLSHRLWAARFAGDPAILGRNITLDGERYTVIGVMPEASSFDRGWSQFWRPLAFKPAERTRDFHWLQAMGRLKPGITIEQARSEMDVTAAQIADAYPVSNKGWGVQVDRFTDVIVAADLKRSLWLLMSAVGMLLLIACANLANLTLARGTSREREIAVRAALGAGRGRLVRQLLTENFLIAIIGGGLGLGVGYGSIRALQLIIPPFTLPRDVRVQMDGRVALFALIVSVATGILVGLWPALHRSAADVAGAIKEGARGLAGDGRRGAVRRGLVVLEVALAFMLLVGGGLLIRTFFQTMNRPLGIDATNVLTLRLPIPNDRFVEPAALIAHVRDMVARVSRVPGVAGAAAADALPLQGWSNGMPFRITGRSVVDPANRPAAGMKMVQSDYFSVLGIRVIKGRVLNARDIQGATPVALVNETFVRQYFQNEEPIGQTLWIQEIVPGVPQLGAEIPWEIVGVIADERFRLEGTQRAGIYVSMEQSPTTYVSLAVRTRIEPGALARPIEQAIHQLDRSQAVSDVQTLDQIKDEAIASNRLRTSLLAIFATLALLLSAIGIFGVISYGVAQRSHEMGVRAALGATSSDLLKLVLQQGLALTGAGLACGFVGAVALASLLGSLVVGVGSRDPWTLIVSAIMLSAVGLLACYLPARRAAGLDPLIALRDE
jgi:putative ABC transport system permease protein